MFYEQLKNLLYKINVNFFEIYFPANGRRAQSKGGRCLRYTCTLNITVSLFSFGVILIRHIRPRNHITRFTGKRNLKNPLETFWIVIARRWRKFVFRTEWAKQIDRVGEGVRDERSRSVRIRSGRFAGQVRESRFGILFPVPSKPPFSLRTPFGKLASNTRAALTFFQIKRFGEFLRRRRRHVERA